MVMKAHKKIKSGMWLIVETVLVFVLGWFLAEAVPEYVHPHGLGL